MREFIGWAIGIVAFVWATISSFSIFAELKFLVDGWSWSVEHVPIPVTFRQALLYVGQWVSVKVANYRDFVHWLVATLNLPHYPQLVYDTAGVVAFSIRQGGRAAKADFERHAQEDDALRAAHDDRYDRFAREAAQAMLPTVWLLFLIPAALSVALVMALLFGIDWLYRSFA